MVGGRRPPAFPRVVTPKLRALLRQDENQAPDRSCNSVHLLVVDRQETHGRDGPCIWHNVLPCGSCRGEYPGWFPQRLQEGRKRTATRCHFRIWHQTQKEACHIRHSGKSRPASHHSAGWNRGVPCHAGAEYAPAPVSKAPVVHSQRMCSFPVSLKLPYLTYPFCLAVRCNAAWPVFFSNIGWRGLGAKYQSRLPGNLTHPPASGQRVTRRHVQVPYIQRKTSPCNALLPQVFHRDVWRSAALRQV